MHDITVAIVTYNDEKTIANALESIFAHLPANLSCKVYIIDNASTDRTREIVSGFPGAELVRQEKNIGFGRAHNVLLDRLDSHYHAIINPDIEIRDDVFSALYDYMEKHPDVGAVAPCVYYPDGTLQHHAKRDPTFFDLFIRVFFPRGFKKRQSRYMMLDADFSREFDIEVATGCFMFVRTEEFVRAGGFDERFFLYFEDSDLSRRIRQNKRLVCMPAGTIKHHWNRASRKRPKLFLIMLGSAIKYFFKWGFRKGGAGGKNA